MGRAARAFGLGLALFCAAGAFAAPARADLADKLLSALAQYAGVDPDSIEMARYAIHSPANAAVIFGHAASLDLPFFAIVGAVKAAKNQSIPGVGTFTEGVCLSPITAIDQIFGDASGYIDDLAGQAKTTGIVNQAKQYAVQYAQQQGEAGKQQIVAQLNQNVPYFGELPVICDFAFHTNLKAERNVQSSVSDTVRAIRDAYNAFKDGNIADGVEALVDVGFNAGTVCKLADEIVSGGVISGTPILGDIAEGACKGFAGAIIKGVGTVGKTIYNGGKEVVNAAACAVESLWGGCDSDDPPPPPPSGIGNAAAFCAPYGGIASAMSKTNAPDDYSVVCNDGSKCIAKPGQPPRCATGAQIAAHEAKMKQEAADRYQDDVTKLAAWRDEFVPVWGGECEDQKCRDAMPWFRLGGFGKANQMLAAETGNFTPDWNTLHFLALLPVEKEARAEIDASKQRSIDLNKQITANASQGWEEIAVAIWSKQCFDDQCKSDVAAIGEEMAAAAVALQAASPDESSLHVQGEIGKEYGPKFKDAIDASYNRHVTAGASQGWAEIAIGIWTKQCWDQQCKDEIVDLANQMAADAVAMQAANPDDSSLHVQGVVGKTYGPKFKAAVDASNKRKILADPNAPADKKLAAYDCSHFLGRAQEWLCPAVGDGFVSCTGFVKAGSALFCISPAGLSYGTPDRVISTLKGQKCVRIGTTGLAFSCATQGGKDVCQRFVKGGMDINCNAVLPVLKLAPPPASTLVLPKTIAPKPADAPRVALAAMGCERFGPNPQDWVCPDARTFAACAGYVRSNSAVIAACLERDNQAIYSTDRRAIAFLEPQGCRNDSNGPLGFTCSTAAALAVCQQFITGGMRMVCKPLVTVKPLTIAPLRLPPATR